MSAGVLNAEQVSTLILSGDAPALKSAGGVKCNPDASSIDLPLGNYYWQLPASVRPSGTQEVIDVLRQLELPKKELTPGTILSKNTVYLIEIAWDRLHLPDDICARATAKSSIGRLDALVRLVTDKQPEFDRIQLGQPTKLYVEVVPLTFNLKVSPGTCLSQLRFIFGKDDLCLVSVDELKVERNAVLVNSKEEDAVDDAQGDRFSVLLSLDAAPDKALGFSGFVATKDCADAVDPTLREPKSGDPDLRLDPHKFWSPVTQDARTGGILIEQERFYILRSYERFRIPAHFCVECQAYSESIGDIRIHYAGFAHPHFGYDRSIGTPLIFEVRGFSMNTMLRHRAPLAKVQFRRMSIPATEKKAENKTYDNQELTLSACFQNWK